MEHTVAKKKRWFGLQAKFLLFYFVFIILLIVSISLTYYYNSSRTLLDMATENTLAILQKNNRLIDDSLSMVSEYANGFVADEALTGYLDAYEQAQSTYEIYQLDAPISRLLNNYFLSARGVFSANVMTRRMPYGMLKASNIIPAGTFPESRVFRLALAAEGKTVWIPTYNFFEEYKQANIPSENASYQKVFTAAKLIRRMGDDYAVVVINFLEDIYRDVFQEHQANDQAIHLVVSPDGKVVSHENSALVGATLDLGWMGDAFERQNGFSIIELNGRECIMCYDTSRVTGWLSTLIIDRQALLQGLIQGILHNLAIIAVLILVVPLLLALFVNTGIIRPLDNLQQGMRTSGKGIFDRPVQESGFAEIRDLIRRFNRSNQHIDQLIHENYEAQLLKQEAELNAYNLQLNPHFILNSLNIINLELIRFGQESLSDTVVALSGMMEYTLRTRDSSVPFRQDWQHTSSYLQVMQKRYKGKFSVTADIQPELWETQVPKFFLQPVVENSVLHGFEGIDYPGEIIIRAYTEEDKRVFEVRDNGRGISPEVLAMIHAGETSRIGLNNIRYRIQYIYGEAFGLTAHSVPHECTVVKVTLPL